MAPRVATTLDVAETTAPVLAIDRRARQLVFASLLVAVLLSGLDQNVVGTALPRIITDLQGADRFVWVVSAYLLGSTILQPVYGKFSDVYGRRPMFLIGSGLFTAGSALCGLSQNMDQLIVFRAVQGLGAAGVLPVATAAVGDLFSPRERGRYVGMFGATFGVSFLVGPFVGGWLTQNISWHWIFYVNVPFALVAMLMIARLMPNRSLQTARARDLDYLGIVVFAAAMIPLLIGLTNKGSLNRSTGQLYGWSDLNVGGLIGVGIVILALFAFVEWRARHAIMPLDLFRNRNYALGMLATLLFALAGLSPIFFMPRFYQTVSGVDPTTSGYFIWPLVLGTIAGAAGGGALITRVGRYKWLLAGSGVVLVLGAYLMTMVNASSTNWTLWPFMLVLGLGIGPSLSGFTVVVQSVAPEHRLGTATSTQTVIRSIGAVLGLAIGGTVFSTVFQNELPNALVNHDVPSNLVASLLRLSGALQGVGNGAGLLRQVLPPQAQQSIPQIIGAARDAFAAATASVFWVALIAGLAALLTTVALRDLTLKHEGAQ